MPSPSIVRPAVPDDEQELWRLFRMAHAENALLPISDRKVQYHLDRFLRPNSLAADDMGPRGSIGVIGPVGALEGAIVLMIAAHWYTEHFSLDELLNFVDPQHRASHHAKALIGYAKHIVDEIRKGAPDFRLVIGVLSTTRMAAKARLYERQKLTPAGTFFVYPAPPDIDLPQRPQRTN